MWRFKPSKYKNATPKVSKRPEGWITEICVNSQHSSGNLIQTSAAFIAFNVESGGGGSLGILNINDSGCKRNAHSQLNAHTDFITDFEFCSYDDGLLVTGSQDHHAKVWRISQSNENPEVPANPLVDLLLDNGVDAIKFNPVVDCLLSTAADQRIQLWDVNTQQNVYSSSHADVVQGLSWKANGQLLASCGKDNKLHVVDPRDPNDTQVAASHSNNRDVRVLWLGDSDHILTTGFGSGRQREVFVRDVKKLNEPVFTYTGESSLGVLIPLYDPDTKMLFFVAKADTAVSFWEVTDKDPFLQEVSKYMGSVQAKGAALVPKRALNVMSGEVNKLLILGPDCIAPLPYIVPRKSYREFHSDLFPDTPSPEPVFDVSDWSSRKIGKRGTVSLDPSARKTKPLIKFNHKLGYGPQDNNTFSKSQVTDYDYVESPQIIIVPEKNKEKPCIDNANIENLSKPPLAPKPASPGTLHKQSAENYVEKTKLAFTQPPTKAAVENSQKHKQRPTISFGIRVSKFRHLNGLILPTETNITDVSSLTRTIPGESDGFQVNTEFLALPLGTGGGLIGLLKIGTQGRAYALADFPGVLCGTKCLDFTWDPFDSNRLITACDTCDIQVWDIGEKHLKEKVSEPSFILRAPADKINIVKFHPCARDILCCTGSDLLIRVWNLNSRQIELCLAGHTDQILALAWSPDGQLIATVCKDQIVRVYDPRASAHPVQEGQGPEGIRGARIVWVLQGSHIVVSGFNKVSERQAYLYSVEDISTPLGNVGLDVSPATLIPFYDEDSSTLFLTGKGDATVYAFEIATDLPYFHPLSHYKCSGPHQALSLLPKYICNVREVEFARFVRLTTSSIETLSFKVPRLRSEYFQDDIFPNTRVTSESTLSAEDWLCGQNELPKYISLRPDDMALLSEAPTPVKTTPSRKPSPNPSVPLAFEGDIVLGGSLAFMQGTKEKEEQIVQAMMSQCQFQQNSLPQDAFDGVDPQEWDEDEAEYAGQDR